MKIYDYKKNVWETLKLIKYSAYVWFNDIRTNYTDFYSYISLEKVRKLCISIKNFIFLFN